MGGGGAGAGWGIKCRVKNRLVVFESATILGQIPGEKRRSSLVTGAGFWAGAPSAAEGDGWIYLAFAVVLNGAFLGYAVRLYLSYSDALARSTFRYSIAYLAALFAALLIDHYFTA